MGKTQSTIGKTERTPEEPVFVDFISLRGDASSIAEMMGHRDGKERANLTEIEFDPGNTQMIAYGIDLDDGCRLPGAKDDAILISRAFIDAGVVLEKNTHCYFASDHADNCTLSGMEKSVRNACKNTADNGLIILFYAGHSNGPSLIPKNFRKDNKGLTAEKFCGWLSGCAISEKVAGVVCILDCCYAEGLFQDKLSAADYVDSPASGSNLYIIAATSTCETAVELPGSGFGHHSFFSLSLKYYGIKETKFISSPGSHSKLPLSNIYDRSKECCTKLSCLLECNPDSVPSAIQNPTFNQAPLIQLMVRKHDIDFPREPVPPMYTEWLRKVEEVALNWLNQKKLLDSPDILMAAVCSMAYAIGKFQASCDDQDSTVFDSIAESIMRVTQGSQRIALTQEHKKNCDKYHKMGRKAGRQK